MRFSLTLTSLQPSPRLTLNYQYPLSAAIYKILQCADKEYATFLHGQGYQFGGKTFKLFTFSDLRTPFVPKGDRMIMQTNTATLIICFHMPDAAEYFIRGLFMHQQIEIADSIDKTSFLVQQVTAEKKHEFNNESVLLQPISPVVVGRKNERGHYDYISPEDKDFAELVAINLSEKYASINNIGEEELRLVKNKVIVKPIFFKLPPRHRLITIKEGTNSETKVKGFYKFRLQLEAPASVIEIALNCGIGMNNAMGMGCVEIVSK